MSNHHLNLMYIQHCRVLPSFKEQKFCNMVVCLCATQEMPDDSLPESKHAVNRQISMCVIVIPPFLFDSLLSAIWPRHS
jgi:hypothetical protein